MAGYGEEFERNYLWGLPERLGGHSLSGSHIPTVAFYENWGSLLELFAKGLRSEAGWKVYYCRPRWLRRRVYLRKKHMPIADVLRLFISTAIFMARHRSANAVVVDSMQTGVGVLFWKKLFRMRIRVVIWGFNVPRRRQGVWQRVWRSLFSEADLVCVYGTADIPAANGLFGIPRDKFLLVPFARAFPTGLDSAAALPSLQRPGSVVAVGGNARDYRTLVDAVRATEIQLTIVAREYSTAGLQIPANVAVWHNIPLDEADRAIRDAELMVLPLDGSEPACGQVTLVTAFLLGTPVIASDCEGIRDYIIDGETGLIVEAGNPVAMRTAIERLLGNAIERERLAENAKKWSQKYATVGTQHRVMGERIARLVEASL